jgi:methyl-accepting chemotaxis protein
MKLRERIALLSAILVVLGAGIAQIALALSNLEQMNRQNADSAVHTSVSSLELNREANGLRELVCVLQTIAG